MGLHVQPIGEPSVYKLKIGSRSPSFYLIIHFAHYLFVSSLPLADQNCIELHELNIVPRLVSLITSQEKVIIAHSILCLAPMSSHRKLK